MIMIDSCETVNSANAMTKLMRLNKSVNCYKRSCYYLSNVTFIYEYQELASNTGTSSCMVYFKYRHELYGLYVYSGYMARPGYIANMLCCQHTVFLLH